MAFLRVDAGGKRFGGRGGGVQVFTVPNCEAAVVLGGRESAAGSCCVVKHRGVPLYEWNQVPHRSLLLVQLSQGPGADGAPV